MLVLRLSLFHQTRVVVFHLFHGVSRIIISVSCVALSSPLRPWVLLILNTLIRTVIVETDVIISRWGIIVRQNAPINQRSFLVLSLGTIIFSHRYIICWIRKSSHPLRVVFLYKLVDLIQGLIVALLTRLLLLNQVSADSNLVVGPLNPINRSNLFRFIGDIFFDLQVINNITIKLGLILDFLSLLVLLQLGLHVDQPSHPNFLSHQFSISLGQDHRLVHGRLGLFRIPTLPRFQSLMKKLLVVDTVLRISLSVGSGVVLVLRFVHDVLLVEVCRLCNPPFRSLILRLILFNHGPLHSSFKVVSFRRRDRLIKRTSILK